MSRTVEATGIDLMADSQDLLTTATGDLEVLIGVEVIIDNLLRLLTTAPGGYARYLRVIGGVEVYNPNFHNTSYNYLSHPLNSTISSAIVDGVREAALQETRVVIENIIIEGAESELSFLNSLAGKVNIKLTYHIKGENELKTSRVQLPIIEKEAA
jgi:hypothetical protein